MAEIILPQRTQLPNTVGGVKAPYELADQSGTKNFGRAVERTAAFSLDKIIDVRAGNEYADWENTARAEEETLRSFVKQNPYATKEQLEAKRDSMLANIEKASTKMTTGRARDWAKRSIYSQRDALKAKATGVIEEVVIEQETAKLRLNIDNAVATGDYEGLKRIYGDAAESGLLPTGDLEDENGLAGTMFKRDAMQLQANAMKIRAEQKKAMIDSLKPGIVDSFGENYDMKDALPFIDGSIDAMKKAGQLTDVEAVEARQDLTNWASDTAEERKSAAKQQEKLNVVQTAEAFADKLIEGSFNADDIALSNLNEAQKKAWTPVLEGKRKDPPKMTAYEGSQSMTKTLLDYSTGLLGKGESIDRLVKERYINQSITDADFEFAVNRIKNPYPQHVAETVSGIFSSSKDAFGVWFSGSEKKKSVKVNGAFLSWLDSESKDGKYPSGEEMYKYMNELGVVIDTPKDLPRSPKRVAPKKTDPTFITSDEAYDELPSGTEFYDGLTGTWMRKP